MVRPYARTMRNARAHVTSTLADRVTNLRTGQDLDCRVDTDTRAIKLDGMSQFIRLPRWDLIFPDGSDIRAGDEITHPIHGRYVVMEMSNPTTISASVNCFAILITDPDGKLAYPTTATVTFSYNVVINGVPTNEVVTSDPVDVLIFESGAAQSANNIDITWAVEIATSWRYSDGTTRLQAGHMINWSHLLSGSAALSKEHPRFGEKLSSTFYFKEQP